MFAVTQHKQLVHGVGYFFPRVLLVDWRMFHVSPCRAESTVITEFVLNAQLFKLCDILLCVCVCVCLWVDEIRQKPSDSFADVWWQQSHLCAWSR